MLGLILGMALAAATATQVAETLTVPGPQASLEGTFLSAGPKAPVLLIIPGSGPTDRDGNNPLGVKAAPYRLLAEALAKDGVSTLRIDKRGMFGSKAAIADANKVTIADYAADVHSWVAAARQKTGASCVWVAGHSEGGLVALAAAQRPSGICGVITISAAGRRIGDVLRDQLRANPANAPILPPALAAIDTLERGGTVEATALPGPLASLFNSDVQPFMRDLMRQNPAQLAQSLTVPLLIVQGDKDIQVGVADAKRLAAARPKAELAVLGGVNHVLKTVDSDDRGPFRELLEGLAGVSRRGGQAGLRTFDRRHGFTPVCSRCREQMADASAAGRGRARAGSPRTGG